jgi:DNA-binding SARP family transcriptional activator/tetratricopeptide (TPR) repeat protein
MIDFRILGPLEVLADGRPLELGAPKQRTLLALLLLEANRVVSADRLIDALWDESAPETAHKALQVYVSQLRKLLGRDRLETRSPGYRLRVEPGELDLDRFRTLSNEGRRHDALELWRGPPLAEFAYHAFAETEIAQLEELRSACLEDRIERDLAEGRHRDVIAELEALIRAHPLRERLRAQLMLALYRSGRQGDALDAYQAARRALVDELGIEPSRELRELHQAMLNQSPRLDVAAASEPEPRRGVFVGRQRELSELLAGLDDAFAGRGRLCLLVGEPGIGKSRLADEVIREARARGARILVGRCWEAGGAPAYWPWVQSLRSYIREAVPAALGEQLGAGAADLAQIVPELTELLRELPGPPSVDPESARFRLFDATAEFLRRVSRERPIVLVLDDLHAADTASLLLLQYVARELPTARVLLLAAYRDVDPVPGAQLAEVLAEVAREPSTRRIPLAGLSEADISEYVELTASELGSPELLSRLYEETEGNPLFVGETVRLLSLEGAAAARAIPQTVRDVISRRLRHLSETCNRVLMLASALGREFSLGPLGRMAELSEDELLETLDEATSARVVSDVPGSRDRLRFDHVLIRDTLYEGVTTARRVRLHRLAVESLEAEYGADPGAHLGELAFHAIAGSDFERGLRYGRRAGDHALAQLAYEEAARLYTLALDALELARPADEGTRCELLLSLGEAQVRAGDTPAAKATFAAAAELARHLEQPSHLGRAAMGYAGRIVWARPGGDDRLVPLLEEAVAAVGERDLELRVRLLARLAGALRDEPSRARRESVSAEAVTLARRLGNPDVLAYALDARVHAIVAPDTLTECLALGDEIGELERRTGDRERAIAAHMLQMHAVLVTGDVAAAEAHLAAATRLAKELRQPVQLWLTTANRALMALAAGRFDEAEELTRQALPLGARAQPDHAIPHDVLQAYTLADFAGGLDAHERPLRALVADYPNRPVFRCALVHLLARLGKRAEAAALLSELVADDVAALPFDQEWLWGMSLLAETCVLLGETRSADVVYPLLEPWASLSAVDVAEGFRGSVSRYLGLLAETLGRRDEAARHFEDALAANQRMGVRPWLAYTQHDYARLLDERNPERAAVLRAEARATFAELGMVVPSEPAQQVA